MSGYNYLGTLDDAVARHPWRFKLSGSRLNHSLAVQLIDGRPILLNDGYLVNHPMGRASVMDRSNLLWEMIEAGYVAVMARGGDRYGIHEMPERMAGRIESFRLVVEDRLGDGVAWSDYRARLEEIDARLRSGGGIVRWPGFDAGSGFRALANELVAKRSTSGSLGLGRSVGDHAFQEFLKEFMERMDKDTEGARSQWEALARTYANDPDVTGNGKAFVRSLMNLANEMYHYNFGIMLSLDLDVPVSVETQVSEAFDDLLVTPDVLVEEIPSLPRLHVPKVVTTAPPRKLVQILEGHREVAKAREDWLLLRRAAEREGTRLPDARRKELEAAGRRYAAELSGHLGVDVSYEKTEGLMGAVLGEAVGQAIDMTGLGFAAGVFSAYLLSRLPDGGLGVVTRKFRVTVLKNQIYPPELLRRSNRVVERIKRRFVPSAIEIHRDRAIEIGRSIRRFA